MTPQSVILPQPSEHAWFIVVNLGQATTTQLIIQLNSLLDRKLLLIKQNSDADIKTAIGFGANLWSQLHPTTPKELQILEPINGLVNMPASPADLIIHIASKRSDLCFDLAQTFFDGIKNLLDVKEDLTCFRYMDKRDLTGFIDGTENPYVQQERADVTLIPEGEFKDGSFIFAQRYIHDLDKWHKLDTTSQEHVFGRSKTDSVEMTPETKPHNAHIARTVIENSEGEELHIVRHSLPYGTGNGDKGIFFIAYTKELERINTMLSRMYGTSGDGIQDHLLSFTTPQDGAYYFCPSEELLNTVINTD